ncbi:MAG: HipA domain-containing protein [Archangium sp.]
MTASLTLEMLLDGRWEKAAILEFPDATGDVGRCYFEYEFAYLEARLGSHRFDTAASLRLPLTFGPTLSPKWPSFLDDVRPMANARRWWLNRLGLADAPSSDLRLLSQGTVAPVGNLRIAESVPPRSNSPPRRFPADAVVEREHDFIEWAAEHGAQVGGATGAGGDSPKLLLRKDPDGRVWIDVWQDEPGDSASHLLVKFARTRHERDQLILRSEYVFYRALAELGIDTISTEGMELREGQAGPSLWLPRFDVRRRDGQEVRLGVESMYSLLSAGPGSRLRHQDVLAELRKVVPASSWPALLLEYVRRDVLNLVFGNSDNHGRNTSLLKSEDAVCLSPVYDFAPMKMDLDGIARSTTWGPLERGGDINWQGVISTFGEHEATVRDGLRELGEKLTDLPVLLMKLGLPKETLEFPGLGLQRTDKRLKEWGLL